MSPVIENFLTASALGFLTLAALMAMLPWITPDSKYRYIPVLMTIIVSLGYAQWRIFNTVPSIDEPINFLAGIIFLAIEMIAVFSTLLSFVTLTRNKNRSEEATQNLTWYGDKHPLIDVFICTYNEEREILERTMIGAKAMSYPNFRVWVLDDGRREWLRDFAGELGCGYITRTDNAHAKAGNINNGLRHIWGLDEPSQYVSILDADFVPARDFLSRTVALFHDKEVGIVQTPQHFINPDPIQMNLRSSDIWPDEQRYFFNVLMPAKDAWGTAFCCGTSSLISIDALKITGGFPTDSVTEDYLLTISFRNFGLKTVYLNEQLSLGLAPEGIKEYVTQRSRWCLGLMQIMKSRFSPFNPDSKLTLKDRLSLLESFGYWSGTYLFRVACLFVPIIYLLFGIKTFDVGAAEALQHFLPFYIINVVIIAWLSKRTVLPIMNDLGQFLAIKEILQGVYIGLFGDRNQKFKVTAKGGDRSKLVIHYDRIYMFGSVVALTIIAILFAFQLNPARDQTNADGLVLFWSWYNIIVLSLVCFVCVEFPRYRHSDRIPTKMRFSVTKDGIIETFEAIDVSIGGMLFDGETKLNTGDRVTVRIEDANVGGEIVRKTGEGFSIKFDRDDETRRAMIRFVYSGLLKPTEMEIKTTLVAGRVIRRFVS